VVKIDVDLRLTAAIKDFRKNIKPRANIYDGIKALGELLPILKEYMDKQIKKIEKKEKGVAKDLKGLAKADKKRDKVCAMGEKAMKKKK
jgi:hypothetical protein